MKEEYFPTKNWYISKRNMELFETESSLVTKSFSVSNAWMASYSVCKVSEKYQVRNFGLPGSVKRLDGFLLCIQG